MTDKDLQIKILIVRTSKHMHLWLKSLYNPIYKNSFLIVHYDVFNLLESNGISAFVRYKSRFSFETINLL